MNASPLPPLILASASPRRKELLETSGLAFSIITEDTEEIHDSSMAPEELCLTNAKAKAHAVFTQHPNCTVIGADTLVFLPGTPLGKPDDLEDARRMLRTLAGKTHEVCTAVAIFSPLGENHFHEITDVTFLPMSDEDIEHYLKTVHVLDKAGSYSFQDHKELIIASTKGDTNNVIGLPRDALLRVLASWGYAPSSL